MNEGFTGLYSREEVAAFFGKKVEDVKRMIAEDGLPVVVMPGKTRGRSKFSALQLWRWLNARSATRWTVEDVIAELERCVPSQEKRCALPVLARIVELQGLCAAAEVALRKGVICARLLRAIGTVVGELELTEVTS